MRKDKLKVCHEHSVTQFNANNPVTEIGSSHLLPYISNILGMYYELFIRFFIGGAVIAGTIWIAEFFDPKLGGMIATIPSATIVSLLIVGSAVG